MVAHLVGRQKTQNSPLSFTFMPHFCRAIYLLAGMMQMRRFADSSVRLASSVSFLKVVSVPIKGEGDVKRDVKLWKSDQG